MGKVLAWSLTVPTLPAAADPFSMKQVRSPELQKRHPKAEETAAEFGVD